MKKKTIFVVAALFLFIITPSLFAGYAGDINYDGKVNYIDIAIFSKDWLKDINVPESIVKIELNSEPNWTTEGQWQYGTPMGMGGSAYGNPDPNRGYTDCNVYGVNLNGDYTVTIGGPYCLTTGEFNCNQYYNVELKFARWLNTDEPNYVTNKVEVSNNFGINWSTVWENSTAITDSNWKIVQHDISQFAAGHAHVYIRWSYEILDDRAYPYSGWNIDDIELLGRLHPNEWTTDDEWLRMYLYNVRLAINIYRAEHNLNILPGEIAGAGGSITAATAASFVNALCYKTDEYGNVGTTDNHRFGPYMHKIPDNPFSEAPDTVVTVADKSEGPSSVAVGASRLAAGGNASGWYFVCTDNTDVDYGLFHAADPCANPIDGKLHIDY